VIKIAHRGNYKGRNAERENTVAYIEEAIAAGYNVEIDVWLIEKTLHLGHDFPGESIELSFLERPEIWTHAKNLVGYVSLYNNPKVHVFWHNKDDFVFTSKGIKWCKTHVITYDGVMVMPEFNDYHTEVIRSGNLIPLGICSDNFDKFNPDIPLLKINL
jgi:hypothetical protein